MDNLLDPTSVPSTDSTGDPIPSYLTAADNHTVGNTLGASWFDPSTWSSAADAVGTSIGNLPKFAAVSVLSGADSLYNTAATVGSWVGVGDGTHDTYDFISGIDDNLGQYYAQNREAADLAGFIATSFIPGLGGVKLLNAGQKALKVGMSSGMIGGNLARATGLLVPETEMYVKLAARDIVNSQGAISAINVNTVKALGAGFYQNVLEAAAFETAVQATMSKSPILQGQDGWDIAKNIAFGGLVGGAIGGAFTGAKSLGGIKKLVGDEVAAAKPFSSRVQPLDATPADQKIILTAEDRDATAVPIQLTGEQFPLGDSGFEVNSKLRADKVEKANNYIRTNINSMVVGTDGTVGNMVADALHMSPAPNMLQSVLHLDEISTLGTTTRVEQAASKAIKNLDPASLAPLETRYIKLVGEDAGNVIDSQPLISSIADTVKTSSKLDIETAVRKEVQSYGFKQKTLWNAAKLTGKTAHTEAEARYIWADRLLPEIKDGTVIHENDIPLLERVYKDQVAGKAVDYKLAYTDGSTGPGLDSAALLNHLSTVKPAIANDLLQGMVLKGTVPVEHGTESIAKIVNMKQAALEGNQSTNAIDDLFAKQANDRAYHDNLVTKGLRSAAQEPTDTRMLPTYAKLAYRNQSLADVNGNVLDGMTWIKQQQVLFQQAADNVFAKNSGTDIAGRAIPISDNVLINANLNDGGAGLTSFANGGYGSLGSYMQQIGANVTRPLKQLYREATSDAFESPLVRMGSKREAAIEFDVINNKLAATTEQYVLDVDGYAGAGNNLISKKIRDYQRAIEAGEDTSNLQIPKLQQGAAEFIPVKNQETYDTIAAHIQRDGTRVAIRKEINAVQGMEDNKADDIFRPIRPNTNDYPFFAFVKDNKVTGAGHTSMIHAASENELQQLISKVPTDKGYKVILKDQAEEYYQAKGEYEYARTLNENYIDSDLMNRGVNSQFFVKTDPQKIVNDILQQHLRADDITATELMRMKYQPTFDWLEDQGKQFSQIESSQYGGSLSRVEKFGKNPYTDYIKTALDVSKASEFPLLYGANRALDGAVSKVYGQVSKLWASATKPDDLDAINEILKANGINNAYSDAATVALANHQAPKGVLSKFIRTTNGILSKFTLALDPLNGLNNAIGANILRSTELKQLTDAINSGNTELAGQLGSLAKIGVPGTASTIVSPTKLLAKSISNFVKDDGTLLKQYQSEGLIKDSLTQFKSIMDDFTLQGTETTTDLDKRISSGFAKARSLASDAVNKGEQYTGNKFFEQFNRFMSADVMRQITDLGEQHGLMSSAESMAYRNTFVNRVEGNTIASQRPVMFQGPIGQAVGLFQSYQFNLMQQMFRYVAEGTSKDAAMLLGLQGTLYGINGLPAFNAINTHIIGNLSGNTNHTDLYDATYGIAGKTAGDFLMYGIPSSIIQTNIYSRGDINPRQLTIIPTNFSDVPIVNAYSKLFSNVFSTLGKIKDGGNVWESMLQGVEHNGISRPLAGLAQLGQATTGNGQVFSTSSKGTILGSNDFLSLASLSRLVGGRPLDEAIINDGTYRIQAYEAAQKQARDKLSEAIKTTGIQGQQADSDQMMKFAAQYAATGGKQVEFNKYVMNTYKNANAPQSEVILKQLANPFTQKMQILMGGRNDLMSTGMQNGSQ
jgi:hypothetical protein